MIIYLYIIDTERNKILIFVNSRGDIPDCGNVFVG